ncbi:thioredoxin domain-containing protein [uncultured Mucilaginibacter sp.]|uniref:DsbA family protein n=1 Tax=uncultured Mucilaginibacter sp. TaxID=797541 RepID=UPI002612B96C|nr:thioredoxin domain-containing protein [uncultured Mucilaginibacter sp.]
MSAQLKTAVSSQDHVQGSSNATIKLVEYGDYQCSYCGEAYPIIKAVQQTLGNDLELVFRNFPLPEVHPDAENAAKAAEAAALQNKFWEMHDMLYENQQQLDEEHLVSFAKKIGLDVNQFKSDMQKSAVSDKIENDFESGVRSGVNGTPSFFINGKKYDGDWQDEDGFTQYLKSQLQ